jgi:GH24 family phage-related lysozyme (muramidase)
MDYKARMYDPYLNRWTQPDTIITDQNDSQDLNRYSYVDNSPINHNDPTGHMCDEDGNCYNANGKYIVNVKKSPNSISQSGKVFIENAESLYGITNQARYNDINGHCTIGYGSLISNDSCGLAETIGHRFFTQDGMYYVLDRWENQPFALNNVSRHPVKNPIWALSDDEAEKMMDIELDHQAAKIASGLRVGLNQNQWDAVQSFVYQTGKVEAIVDELNNNPISDVGDWIRNYGKDSKTGVVPYAYRRGQEADLFSFGYYDYFK